MAEFIFGTLRRYSASCTSHLVSSTTSDRDRLVHPKGAVAKAYGAYREGDGISERALFIVDKEGKIAYKDIHNIADQPDNEDLFEVLRKL